MESPRPARPGTLAIAASSAFFAVMAVLTKSLAGTVPAAELVTVRHSVGLLAMVALFLVRRRRPRLDRLGLLFLRGFFGGGAVLLYFVAIQLLGAAPATVLNYVSPDYAAVLASIFFAERPSPRVYLGLGLATVGAIVVTVASGDFSAFGPSALGALAGLGSGLMAGAAMTATHAVREDTDAPTVFLAFCVVGLLMSLPFSLTAWQPLSGAALATALIIGATAIVGQLLFTYGMGHTTATAGAATTQLVPVFAWTLSLLVLHEPIRPLAALGAALCVGGVLWGMVRFAPREKSA